MGYSQAGRNSVGEMREVCVPILSMRANPKAHAPLIHELVYGEWVTILESDSSSWAKVKSLRDGYTGWVQFNGLTRRRKQSTHVVRSPIARVHAAPDMHSTSDSRRSLYMTSFIYADESRAQNGYLPIDCMTGKGWIRETDLVRVNELALDYVETALCFAGSAGRPGAPYQYGGITSLGLDCSGLIRNALFLAGLTSHPRDSGPLEQLLIERERCVMKGALDRNAILRGHLIFWHGHVAIALDADAIVHATDYKGGAVIQPLDEAIADRIKGGDGEITSVCDVQAEIHMLAA